MSTVQERFQNEIDALLHDYIHGGELLAWIEKEKSARQQMREDIGLADGLYQQCLMREKNLHDKKIDVIREEEKTRTLEIQQAHYHIHENIAKELRQSLEITIQHFDKEQREVVERWLILQLSQIEHARKKCNYSIVDINSKRKLSLKNFQDAISKIHDETEAKRIEAKKAYKARLVLIKKECEAISQKCEHDNIVLRQSIWENYLNKQAEAYEWIKGKSIDVYNRLCSDLSVVGGKERDEIEELLLRIKANPLDENLLAATMDKPAMMSSSIREDRINQSQTDWCIGLNHYLVMVSKISNEYSVVANDARLKYAISKQANAELRIVRINEANNEYHQTLKDIGNKEAADVNDKGLALEEELKTYLSQILVAIQLFRKELVFIPPNDIPNLHDLRETLSKFAQFISGDIKKTEEEDILAQDISEMMTAEEARHEENIHLIETEWMQQKDTALGKYKAVLATKGV